MITPAVANTLALIVRCAKERFHGKVEIDFHDGAPRLVRTSETIKPEELSATLDPADLRVEG